MVTFKSEFLISLTSFDRNPHRILACSYILSCCDCRFPHFDSLASRLAQSLTSSCLCCNLVLCLEWRIKLTNVWVWSLTQFSYFPFRVSFAHLCLRYMYLTKLFKPAESLLGLSLILNSKGFLDLQRATFPQASHVTHIFGRICPSIQTGRCRWRAQYTGPRADKGGDMLHPHTEILRPSWAHYEEHYDTHDNDHPPVYPGWHAQTSGLTQTPPWPQGGSHVGVSHRSPAHPDLAITLESSATHWDLTCRHRGRGAWRSSDLHCDSCSEEDLEVNVLKELVKTKLVHNLFISKEAAELNQVIYL